VPHDVTILQGETAVFEGEDITGPDVMEYDVPPLTVGEYRFICSIHPPMTGTLVAQ
jgi:plastocyanin